MRIELREVSFSYEVELNRWHLDRLNLEIPSGQIVGIVGPSGCGKSTLLRLIGGLLSPKAGSVRVNEVGPENCRDKMGFVFQTPRLLSWLNASENVALPLKLNFPNARHNVEVATALREVGLNAFADAFPDQLSGGMAHRIAIARALVTKPSLLLLDEPFGSLDVATRQQMQALLCKIAEDLSLTCVVVTHDLMEAAYLCNRIIVMSSTAPYIQGDLTVGTSPGSLPADITLVTRLREMIQASQPNLAECPTNADNTDDCTARSELSG